MNPTIKPTIYPPIKRLGSEEYWVGIVKTINALAPRAVINAASFSTSKKTKTARIVKVARKHWKMYFNLFFFKFFIN